MNSRDVNLLQLLETLTDVKRDFHSLSLWLQSGDRKFKAGSGFDFAKYEDAFGMKEHSTSRTIEFYTEVEKNEDVSFCWWLEAGSPLRVGLLRATF